MELITREELKAKLDRGDKFTLINALGEWAFRAKHIPGSVNYPVPEDVLDVLDKDEEIVVYCADLNCPASVAAYYFLEKHGYHHVRRYAGGLSDWEHAGYPMEGEWTS